MKDLHKISEKEVVKQLIKMKKSSFKKAVKKPLNHTISWIMNPFVMMSIN